MQWLGRSQVVSSLMEVFDLLLRASGDFPHSEQLVFEQRVVLLCLLRVLRGGTLSLAMCLVVKRTHGAHTRVLTAETKPQLNHR